MGAGIALGHPLFMLRQGLPPVVGVQLLGTVKLIRHLQPPFPQQLLGKSGQGQS